MARAWRDAPIFSLLSTYAHGVVGRPDFIPAIREGPEAVVNGIDVLLGPDTDTLTYELYRQNEGGLYVHYNSAGLMARANLWYDTLTDYI
jgi:hypothetical protein